MQKTIFTLFILIVLTGFQNNPKEDFLSKLKKFNQENSSLTADFNQVKSISLMNSLLKSSGKFYYSKPEYLLWDQEEPSIYKFKLKGNKVELTQGNSTQVISSNNPQVVHFKNFILSTINGSIFDSDQFDSEFIRNGDQMEINLIPKNKMLKKRVSSLFLRFDYEQSLLQFLRINEVGGDYTEITFTNQKLNSITDTKIFE